MRRKPVRPSRNPRIIRYLPPGTKKRISSAAGCCPHLSESGLWCPGFRICGSTPVLCLERFDSGTSYRLTGGSLTTEYFFLLCLARKPRLPTHIVKEFLLGSSPPQSRKGPAPHSRLPTPRLT